MSDEEKRGVTGQLVEPLQIFPPHWFVANFNAGVSRDWAGLGPPPYRTALDPLVMFTWHLATESLRRPMPMTFVTSVI